MPPRRGGKSLVTIKVRRMASLSVTAGAAGPAAATAGPEGAAWRKVPAVSPFWRRLTCKFRTSRRLRATGRKRARRASFLYLADKVYVLLPGRPLTAAPGALPPGGAVE